MHAARRLWLSLEPLHAVVYFAPEVRAAGKELGLRGFWDTYFAFRAAPLGAVAAGQVVASFAGFEPAMVGKALPSAWTRTSVADCLATRVSASAEVLRAVGVSPAACATAVALLSPVVLEPTGRPLGMANAALPLPADPVEALWQMATTLREHRGDGHVAALVTAGLTGLDAMLLQVANGRFPEETMRGARGWSPAEWAAARKSLVGRGLLGTDAGAELLASVEAVTDSVAWQGGLAALGDATDAAIEVLAPSVTALWDSGVLPEANPIGVLRA